MKRAKLNLRIRKKSKIRARKIQRTTKTQRKNQKILKRKKLILKQRILFLNLLRKNLISKFGNLLFLKMRTLCINTVFSKKNLICWFMVNLKIKLKFLNIQIQCLMKAKRKKKNQSKKTQKLQSLKKK